MNREKTKKAIKIMQHYVDGGSVEARGKGMEKWTERGTGMEQWTALGVLRPIWDWDKAEYRIKPRKPGRRGQELNMENDHAATGARNPKRKTPEFYHLSGYRAGWNDALNELLRKFPDVFAYADLKSEINNMRE